jgi:uncharacterized membrane protein
MIYNGRFLVSSCICDRYSPIIAFAALDAYNYRMFTLFRNKYHDREPVGHVQLTLCVAIILQLLIPERYVFGARYLLVFIEFLLLVALTVTTPREKIFRSLGRRLNVLLLIGLTALANGYSLSIVTSKLLQPGHISNGKELILTALNIYLTNIIIFGLLYWEMDAGGPGARAEAAKHEHDFLFPQDQNESYKHPHWQPIFIDYLYLSATNSMAFSPTDTLPLSRRAKILMFLQACLALVSIALIAARAVNIL